MSFNSDKINILGREDKSSIGKFDDAISQLVEKINSLENYYTTSSCAGRIKLIYETEKKEHGLFIFVSHDEISFEQLKAELGKIRNSPQNNSTQLSLPPTQERNQINSAAPSPVNSIIYFKQEPCILHIVAKELGDAADLLEKAKSAGWKRSGIISVGNKNVLELLSTEKLELPIMDKGEVLVDDAYLKLLVDEANSRLRRTRKKIEVFEKLI